MSYLKLIELGTHSATEVHGDVARLGRSPECTVVLAGAHVDVVSALHAELRHGSAGWELKDLGSRNGTFLNGQRLAGEARLKAGDVIGLGETGPRFSVAAVADVLEATRAYGVSLLAASTGRHYEARGVRIRLGRGRECEVRPVDSSDTIVSRVHAELTVGSTGGLVVRDAGSTNGTFVNDEPVTDDVPIRLGDRIMLGKGGPVLIVEGLGTAPQLPAARRRSYVGPKTLRALIGDAIARAKRRLLAWVALAVLVLGAGLYGAYRLVSGEVQETERERRTGRDSTRLETERLRQELGAARAAAAPAALVESLRARLRMAEASTADLRAALGRAQTALSSQLEAGEQRRLAAQAEVQRLRDELAAAERRAPSPATIDSLRRAVTAAEQQTQNLEGKLRAIRASDFATIAQQSQGAVGLVTVSFGHDYYSGTGFVITPDGYLLTNWHVVADSQHARPDTIWVTMADQAAARLADVIVTSQERDIAVLRVRGYQGPYLTDLDWTGTRARQGEPAALIGYPAGSGFAHLRSAVVRTSMTAGIISRATEDVIQFDGMTIGGSSGSPLFNANGAVIAIHRAGLPQAPGFALSVPIKHVVPLLPTELKQRLGLR